MNERKKGNPQNTQKAACLAPRLQPPAKMDAVLDLPTVMEGKKSTSVSEWGWGGQHLFGGVVADLVPRTYLLNYYLLPVRKQEVMLIWC